MPLLLPAAVLSLPGKHESLIQEIAGAFQPCGKEKAVFPREFWRRSMIAALLAPQSLRLESEEFP
jgi:hypothetical protein